MGDGIRMQSSRRAGTIYPRVEVRSPFDNEELQRRHGGACEATSGIRCRSPVQVELVVHVTGKRHRHRGLVQSEIVPTGQCWGAGQGVERGLQNTVSPAHRGAGAEGAVYRDEASVTGCVLPFAGSAVSTDRGANGDGYDHQGDHQPDPEASAAPDTAVRVVPGTSIVVVARSTPPPPSPAAIMMMVVVMAMVAETASVMETASVEATSVKYSSSNVPCSVGHAVRVSLFPCATKRTI